MAGPLTKRLKPEMVREAKAPYGQKTKAKSKPMKTSAGVREAFVKQYSAGGRNCLGAILDHVPFDKIDGNLITELHKVLASITHYGPVSMNDIVISVCEALKIELKACVDTDEVVEETTG